jgi:hypothetical protein
VLWHAQHGATARQYTKALEERGVKVPAYLIPPEPLPGVAPWFLDFWELSTERRFEGAPIPWSAIANYPVSDNEAETFRRLMRAADAAYLEFMAKPPDDRKSLPPMMPPKRKSAP